MFRSAILSICCWLPLPVQANLAHQQWIYEEGLLKYKAAVQYCITTRRNQFELGTDAILWHCDKSDEVDSSPLQFIFDGSLLKPKNSPNVGLCVREGRAGDGADIILWSVDGSEDEAPCHWVYEDEHIKFKQDPRYWLSVRANDIVDGADLILWTGHGVGHRWLMQGPLLKLKAYPEMCMGVREAKFSQGSHVILWSCDAKVRVEKLLAKREDKVRTSDADALAQSGDDMHWVYEGNQIKNKHNPEYCLSVDGPNQQADGTRLVIRRCQAEDDFNFVVMLDGQIRLQSHQEYCVKAQDGNAGDGSDIVLWGCDAPSEEGLRASHDQHIKLGMPSSQQWTVDGDYIRSKLEPAYCLSTAEGVMSDGYLINVWHCPSNKDEALLGKQIKGFRWNVENGMIQSKDDPRYCAGVREGAHGEGADMILWTCDTSRAFQFDFQDHFIAYRADPRYGISVREGRIHDGQHVILWSGVANAFEFLHENGRLKYKAAPHLCVSIREGKAGDGSDIILWQCGDDHAQMWRLEDDRLRHQDNGRYCIEPRQGGTRDGTDLILWTCDDDADGAQWIFEDNRLRLKASKHMCLSIQDGLASDGTNLVLWHCDTYHRQASDEL